MPFPTTLIHRFLPPILVMLAIFVLSSFPQLPKVGDSQLDYLIKQGAHFAFYALLAFTWLRAFTHLPFKTNALIAFTLSVIYALSDEYHQAFVPGREPSLADITLDTLGALTSIIFYPFIKKHLPLFKMGK